MRKKLLQTLLLILFLLPGQIVRADQQTHHLTCILPAPVLLSVLQGLLPLPIMPGSKVFSGNLAIESINRLKIHGNSISLHGMIKGSNLAMHTMIAGQNLKLKLGDVHLPISCDLRLRLDPTKKTIFVTPYFKDTSAKKHINDPVAGLLNGLAGKEYPLSFAEIDKVLSKNMGRPVSLNLRPVLLDMKNDTLTLGLKPDKSP